jgi:hypothetical protein
LVKLERQSGCHVDSPSGARELTQLLSSFWSNSFNAFDNFHKFTSFLTKPRKGKKPTVSSTSEASGSSSPALQTASSSKDVTEGSSVTTAESGNLFDQLTQELPSKAKIWTEVRSCYRVFARLSTISLTSAFDISNSTNTRPPTSKSHRASSISSPTRSQGDLSMTLSSRCSSARNERPRDG